MLCLPQEDPNHECRMRPLLHRRITIRPCPLKVISRRSAIAQLCPLYPRKRTLSDTTGMSALCQKRTSARAAFSSGVSLGSAAYKLLNRHQGLRQFLAQPAPFLVAEVLRLQNHDELLQRSREGERHPAFVFLQYWGARVLADVEGFIEREANADGLRNFALGDLFFIDQERRGRALADAAALIVELNANDVIARRERLIGGNAIFVLRLVRQRVGKHRLALHEQQRPAAVSAADRAEYAVGSALRDGHLGGGRP